VRWAYFLIRFSADSIGNINQGATVMSLFL
jgi:hypothetical protein